VHPTTVDVPGLPPANATYSQVSIVGGLVFVAGQIGIDPVTGQLANGGIQAQTRHAIENIDRCLAAVGSSLEQVAKVNLYLTDSK
jgi:2-iminobutanoate/2-iminopropanoate deaminase